MPRIWGHCLWNEFYAALVNLVERVCEALIISMHLCFWERLMVSEAPHIDDDAGLRGLGKVAFQTPRNFNDSLKFFD